MSFAMQRNLAPLQIITVMMGQLAWASLAAGQGPTSRAVLPGATSQRRVVSRFDGAERVVTETEQVPVPDMFRTEAPLVERNVRFDYSFANHLHEPPADESQFFTELSYAFTEKFGVIVSAPYLIRDNFDASEESGFGDLGAGVRYVAIGSQQGALFKAAVGFNVLAPTGDEVRDLGEGQAELEPELLTQALLTDEAFAQFQLGVGIPTESGGTTELGYNTGLGYVFKDFSDLPLFSYPTVMAEANCFTGVGGAEAGVTVVDLTPGLRWSVGEKTFAGFGVSVPVTGPRELETLFIFSLIYRYGVERGEPAATGVGAPSSRAYF